MLVHGFLEKKLDGGNGKYNVCIAILKRLVPQYDKTADAVIEKEVYTAVEVFGKNAEKFNEEVALGVYVIMEIDVISREWQDKWFTSAKAKNWNVVSSGGVAPDINKLMSEDMEDSELPF